MTPLLGRMHGWRGRDGGPGSSRTGLLSTGGGGHREGTGDASVIVLKFREWIWRRRGARHAPGVVLDATGTPVKPRLRPGQMRVNRDYPNPFGLWINTPDTHCAFCGRRLWLARHGTDMLFTFDHPSGDRPQMLRRVHRDPADCPAVEIGR